MTRMGWMAALLIAVALILPGSARFVAADSTTAVDLSALSPEEQELWTTLTAARTAAGLKPITLDANEISLARDRSADMATRSYFAHMNPDGKTMIDMLPSYGITYHTAGETIAFNLGIPDSGEEAAQGLIASPLHHEILFNNAWTTAGVGHAVDANGKHYFTVIVIG